MIRWTRLKGSRFFSLIKSKTFGSWNRRVWYYTRIDGQLIVVEAFGRVTTRVLPSLYTASHPSGAAASLQSIVGDESIHPFAYPTHNSPSLIHCTLMHSRGGQMSSSNYGFFSTFILFILSPPPSLWYTYAYIISVILCI